MIVNSFSTFMPVEELAEAGILRLVYNYKDEDNRRNPAQFFSPRKKGDERLFGDLSAARTTSPDPSLGDNGVRQTPSAKCHMGAGDRFRVSDGGRNEIGRKRRLSTRSRPV